MTTQSGSKSVWSLLRPSEKWKVVKLGVVLVVGSVFEVVGIGLLLPVVTLISGDGQPTADTGLANFSILAISEISPGALLALLLLVQVLKSAFLGWSVWFQRGVAQSIEVRLSRDLLHASLRKPYEYHLLENSADVMRDIGSAAAFVSLVIDSSLALIIEIVTIALLLSLLIALDPLATLLVLGLVGVAAVLFHLQTRGRLKEWGEGRTQLEARRIQLLQEGLRAITEIKVLNCEQQFEARYEEVVTKATNISRRFVTLASLPRIWLELLAFVSLTIVLASLTLTGQALSESIPILAVFAAAAIRIIPSISKVTLASQNLVFGKSVVRIVESMALQNLVGVAPPIDYVKDDQILLRLRNVSFAYSRTKRNVLKNVSLDVPVGRILGICGESGSGKSTLAGVLLGLLKPSSGEVLRSSLLQPIDDRLTTHRPIGYVPQSVYLIDDSLKNNIAFGVNPGEVDLPQVVRAVEVAHLSQYVSQLPLGMETRVGEAGVRISGGQRQRVGLARALYGGPSLLVLDEFTSSLDKETESDVLSEIADLKRQVAIVVISHSAAVLAMCDQVFEMVNGCLEERKIL